MNYSQHNGSFANPQGTQKGGGELGSFVHTDHITLLPKRSDLGSEYVNGTVAAGEGGPNASMGGGIY